MSDGRLKALTTEWCEVLWKGRYGAVGKWSGKDAKLLQNVVAWADRNYKDDPVAAVKTGMAKYLDDAEPFYADDKHPFAKFAANPAKWMPSLKPKPATRAPQPPRPAETPKPSWSDWQLYEFICAKPDPRPFCKGLVTALPAMKLRAPDFAERLVRVCMEVVGDVEWARLVATTLPVLDLKAAMEPKPHGRDHERRPFGR